MFEGMLFTVLTLLLGIGMLVGWSLVVIGLLRKSKNMKLYGAILGITFTGFFAWDVSYLLNKVVDKVTAQIQPSIPAPPVELKPATEFVEDEEQEEPEEEYNPLVYMQLLMDCEPDSLKGKIPKDFYFDYGFRDWYRIPLRYPYTIVCVDIVQNGSIGFDEDLKGNIRIASNEALPNVDSLAMDCQFLIYAGDHWNGKEGDPYYHLLHWDSGKIKSFHSRKDLFREAAKSGYTGAQELIKLKTYFKVL